MLTVFKALGHYLLAIGASLVLVLSSYFAKPTSQIKSSPPTKQEVPTAPTESAKQTVKTPVLPPSGTDESKNTPVVISYQNYGWYLHNGQSMQYVNGQWYSTPQQNTPSAPVVSTPQTGNSIDWNQWSKNLQNQINSSLGNNSGSGACADHGGVNCSAGAQPNGDVVCADGWRGSTVPYSSVSECSTPYSPAIEAALNQLNQTLGSIWSAGAETTMSVIQGRSQQAYQNWIRDNQTTYAAILGSPYYSNRLRSILASYGL